MSELPEVGFGLSMDISNLLIHATNITLVVFSVVEVLKSLFLLLSNNRKPTYYDNLWRVAPSVVAILPCYYLFKTCEVKTVFEAFILWGVVSTFSPTIFKYWKSYVTSRLTGGK